MHSKVSVKELSDFLRRCSAHPEYMGDEITDPNQLGVLGDTPLHLAARFGSVEEIAALAEWGANLDSVGDYGHTPLHHAAIMGRADALNALLKLGARTDIRNEDGKTALDCALVNGNEATIESLKRHSKKVTP
jgi:ankyrin repeat protein